MRRDSAVRYAKTKPAQKALLLELRVLFALPARTELMICLKGAAALDQSR